MLPLPFLCRVPSPMQLLLQGTAPANKKHLVRLHSVY